MTHPAASSRPKGCRDQLSGVVRDQLLRNSSIHTHPDQTSRQFAAGNLSRVLFVFDNSRSLAFLSLFSVSRGWGHGAVSRVPNSGTRRGPWIRVPV